MNFLTLRFKRSLVILILIVVLGSFGARIKPAAGSEVLISGSILNHLPIVLHAFPPITVFGTETGQLSSASGLDQIIEANSTWVRRNGIRWLEVEPNEGQTDWNSVASLEQELIAAATGRLKTILVVSGTPTWAQHPNTLGFACGPIRPDKLDNFRDFMVDLVARYSVPPYNVRYFEIWNEPDVDPSLVAAPNGAFGCWGDINDPYYGGGYYADMLEAIYGPVKNVDPNVNLMVGGLLLDCNPASPMTCMSPQGIPAAQFLEGILRHNGLNDGSNYFDGVSFHAYDFYGGSIGQFGNGNWNTSWNTTGPVVASKSDMIRSLLIQYNASDKFMMNTEGALLCDSCGVDPDFEETKAIFLVQNYAAAIDRGLTSNIWYSLFGWRNSGLLNNDLSPKPAYNAYKFSRQILKKASTLGEITTSDFSNIAGVGGYKFDRVDRHIWVAWSKDGLAHEVGLLPGVPLAIFDLYGNPISTTMTVTIGITPQYFVWNP